MQLHVQAAAELHSKPPPCETRAGDFSFYCYAGTLLGMTLGTHITVGVAAASPFLVGPLSSSPIAPLGAFALAVASHYAVDMIPHWDWPIQSIENKTPNFLDGRVRSRGAVANDLAIAVIDMSIGVLAVAFAVAIAGISLPLGILCAAIIASVLPDALQLVYFLYKKEPMITHQAFHSRVHTKVRIPSNEVMRGVLLQSPVFLLPLVGIVLTAEFFG